MVGNFRIDDQRAREILERVAVELLSNGSNDLALDVQQLLIETKDVPREYGCACCGGKHTPWTAHCIHCNPRLHLNSHAAEALKACSWAGTSQSNKEALANAIQELESGFRAWNLPDDQLSAFNAEWQDYLVLDRVGVGKDARFVHAAVELAFVSWCKGGSKLAPALQRLANQRVLVKRLRQEIHDLTEEVEKSETQLEYSLSEARKLDTEAYELLSQILNGSPVLSKGTLRSFLKRVESSRAWSGRSMPQQTLSEIAG